MLDNTPVAGIAHIIQLAVAPAFLLAGVGAMIGVMTGRLSRIVDRARVLESQPAVAADDACVERELASLSRRAKVVGRAIGLCTLTALLISIVIAVLFLGAFVSFDPSMVIALLFITAMLSLVIALLHFLSEVYLATAGLRIGHRRTKSAAR
jgi:hypothetical protein